MKNFKVFSFTIFYLSTIFVPTAFSGDNVCEYYLSPDLILREIKTKGAREVVEEVWLDHEKEYFVLQQIKTGDPQWLEVAKALWPGSDAAATMCIWLSLSRALPNAPILVLKMIGNSFPLRQICTLPFIEGEVEIEKAYLNRTEKALISVNEPELEDVRWKCLRIIHYFQEKIYLDEEREKERQYLLKMEKGGR